MNKKGYVMVAAGVAVFAILMFTVSFNIEVREPVVDAKPVKKADIETYKIAKVGNGTFADALYAKFVKDGGKKVGIPDKGDASTLVILAEPIGKEKTVQLIKDKAKVLFVGEEVLQFAADIGEPIKEAKAFGYKIRPADALCYDQHDRVPCGNSESVFAIGGDITPDDLEQAVLEWMGDE